MVHFEHLLAPLTLGDVTIRNRVVWRAHHTALAEPARNFGDPGTFGGRLAAYVAPRVEAGVGMVVVGPALVHSSSVELVRNAPAVWDRAAISGMSRVARVIDGAGSVGLVQLFQGALPVGGLAGSVDALSADMVDDLLTSWARAARNVASAGFLGVELCATPGSMLERLDVSHAGVDAQFLSDLMGRIRDFTAAEFLIGLTVGAIPDRLALGVELTRRCRPAYVDVQPAAGFEPMYSPLNSGFEAGAALREALGEGSGADAICPAIIAGSRVTDPSVADRALAERLIDAVGVTRSLIADPKWLEKATVGRSGETRRCTGCNQGCSGRVQRGLPIGCSTNPVAGFESDLATMYAAQRPRRVVVVGAGPAGLEAAWVAAARRHEVILIEAEAEVGGLVRTAAQLPGRAEMAGFVEWREQECERRGVDIRLNTRAEGALLAGLEPEVVVLATGAGGAGDTGAGDTGAGEMGRGESRGWLDALTALKLLRTQGSGALGERVLVADSSGSVAAGGIAELVALSGAETILCTPHEYLVECDEATRWEILGRLGSAGVGWRPQSWPLSAGDHSETLGLWSAAAADELEDLGSGWRVVHCAPSKPDPAWFALLADVEWGRRPDVVRIGDAVAARDVGAAIADGHRVGRSV